MSVVSSLGRNSATFVVASDYLTKEKKDAPTTSSHMER